MDRLHENRIYTGTVESYSSEGLGIVRLDGAVVFVCIDGRQAGSAGGTYKDVIDIMIEYGGVNACNMDGGSSSIMGYRDTYGLFGEAGTVQVINSYSLLQERPRKMPTFWMVAP